MLKIKVSTISFLLLLLPLNRLGAEYYFTAGGKILEGTHTHDSTGYQITLKNGKTLHLKRSEIIRVLPKDSFNKTSYIYLKGDQLMKAHVVEESDQGITVRKTLDSPDEYRFSSQEVNGITETPLCDQGTGRFKDDYFPMKRFYVTLNPGGLLFSGPSLEFGGQIFRDLTLGVSVRFNALGLYNYYQPAIWNAKTAQSAWHDISYGVTFTYLPQFGTTRNRFFTGIDLIYRNFYWNETGITASLNAIKSGHAIEIHIKAGYRLRLPHNFYLDFGAGIGPNFMINVNENFYNFVKVQLVPLKIQMLGNSYIAVGYEF